MPTIHLIPYGAATINLDVPEGVSLMQAAVSAGVAGIVGECGGSAMCATCHVYVDEAYAGLLAPMSPVEAELLECTASDREPTSRLSCQIKISGTLDGLIVRLPERQQ
ncbi:2Fe-2S iron-sulfur cluster-binding protein [Polaromonas sp.]|uniref:2Fe-2S iron-sulfur cluster-binding protein n=1 Tax=Polaromonas sp. TaxID=1869339 RepID=UPI003567337D